MKMMDMKRKLGESASEDPEYVDTVFTYADRIAETLLKVCTPQELDALMDNCAGMKKVADEYRQRGANALANLCSRPQPSP